jgi:hypothetical protein
MSDDTYSDEMQDVYVQILSNEPNELKLHTMEIIYNSINNGQLAYMDAKDPETGEIIPLLVGLDPTSNGKFKIYPVAQLLIGASNLPKYLVPDGTGSYYDADSEESDYSSGESLH